MEESRDQFTGSNTSADQPGLSDIISRLDTFEDEIQELEVAKTTAEKLAQDWEQKYRDSEEKLEEQASNHWELDNKYADMDREIERLQSALQQSMPLQDWITPPQKLMTALEAQQKKEIDTLKEERVELRREIRRLQENARK
ncbi:hypothetical protein F4777DRAFT_320929 [Nemania sp. FL0916]|nr:hypothetical protein F4777DRAFT_320929 [Nemania sp. FL0916]